MSERVFDWKERFGDKVMNANQAMKLVSAGDHVFIGTGCAEPQHLVKALTHSASHLADTEIFHLLTMGVAPYAEPKHAERFRFNSFFVADNVRGAVQAGLGDYTPIFLSEIPRLFDSGRTPLDVALIQVTPPDRSGLCSLGVSVDIVMAAVRNAVTVIAQVNDRMPWTLGDAMIHVNDIDALVECSEPLPQPQVAERSEVVEQIARHIAKLIDDGSTLELGIGAIPQAVLTYLTDKKDLGIHTEMFTDGIIDLVEAGVITGRRKTVNPGKIVASFCMGTERLYEYIDRNPVFAMHPTEYVNDPMVIAQHDDMVAINVAIEVDLTGQVCADSLGTRFYSGFGGQVDFIRGSAASRGGKPIIALPSTTRDGKHSRIAATLTPGAGVVTTRGDVHWVVTEYGVAYLHGKSVRERAMALIQIAHPRFRNELLERAKALNYVYKDQLEVPWDEMAYPEELETRHTLLDGTEIFVRPVKPTDEELFKDLFYSLSEQSRYQRFFSRMAFMPHRTRQPYVNINYNEQVGLACVVEHATGEQLVGLGQYIKLPNQPKAEFALLISDEWQQRGLGTWLTRYVVRIARQSGITGFQAEVLAANKGMLAVFQALPYELRMKLDSGAYHIAFDFS
jgi:acyl-CoA hydrolase/ribosomal protein S18 acetylase RimI-like enzyme